MSKQSQAGENPYSPEPLQALIEEIARSGPERSGRGIEVWQAMLADPWLQAEVAIRAARFVQSSRLNKQITEDIAQEVLLLLAAKLAADEVMHAKAELLPDNFLAWIGTILDHACSEAARILREYRHPHAELHDVKTTEDEWAEQDRRWDFATVAARLKGRQRSVILLFLQGLEREDIAESLGLHYKQVVYAIEKAKPKLQRWLSAYNE